MKVQKGVAWAVGIVLLGALVLVGLRSRFVAFNFDPSTSDWADSPGQRANNKPIDVVALAEAATESTFVDQGTYATKGASTAGRHFPGIPTSRIGLPLDGDPFVATSREEQRWLDRNGFPNNEQLQAYGAASDAVLAAAAADGDRIAQVTLDGRNLIRGDAEAPASLWNAAVDGSGYALTTLAAFLGGSSTYGDPGSAYALSRVAEMRGDYRQALGRDMLIRNPLTPAERLEAESRALRMFNELNDARRKRFGPNVSVVDPRPVGPEGP